jgi:hypothetical protein
LLLTNLPSIENPSVFKETNESTTTGITSKEMNELSPTEQTVREEGETWTNEEGIRMN